MSALPIFRNFAFLSVLASISACSSTQTTPTTPGPPQSGTTYRGLSDRGVSTAQPSSTLGGVALHQTTSPTLGTLAGTLTHSTGNTTIGDSVFSLTDADGPNASGGLTDTVNATMQIGAPTYADGSSVDPNQFTGTYQYVSAFSGAYPDTSAIGFEYTTGVYGVVTNASDMPSAGTASYSGEASGSFSETSMVTYLTRGTSAVSADFGAGNATIVMKDFTARSVLGTLITSGIGFDEVRLTNVGIQGNMLSGGGIEFYNNGSQVTQSSVIGSGITSVQGGTFFGYDSTTGAPAEVGGVANNGGSIGELTLVFVAQ